MYLIIYNTRSKTSGLTIYCKTSIASTGEKSIIKFRPTDDLNCRRLNGSNIGSVVTITNFEIGLFIFSIRKRDNITLIRISQLITSKKYCNAVNIAKFTGKFLPPLYVKLYNEFTSSFISPETSKFSGATKNI